MQLELVLAHADVVAGLEAGGAQGGDDADLVEPLLEVGERLLVLEVVALEEQLDTPTEDPEAAVPLALHRVATLADRPVDPMLDLELGGAEVVTLRPSRRPPRQSREDRPAQLGQTLAGR